MVEYEEYKKCLESIKRDNVMYEKNSITNNSNMTLTEKIFNNMKNIIREIELERGKNEDVDRE